MNTITIPIPEGFEIDSLDKSTGEVKLKAKKLGPITDRIKGLADAVGCLGHTDHEVIRLDAVIAATGHKDPLCNYQKAVVICKALNEGWTPDWSNHNQAKYYPWFEIKVSSGFRFHDYAYWYSVSNVGSRLCFKSSELAEYAGKQFTDVYKSFMVIE